MMDPYYRVKSDIHKKRPTFAMFCFAWMLFMATIAGFFGYYSYNIETRDICIVKDDEYLPIYPIPIGVTENEKVEDVSY